MMILAAIAAAAMLVSTVIVTYFFGYAGVRSLVGSSVLLAAIWGAVFYTKYGRRLARTMVVPVVEASDEVFRKLVGGI
jgi:hypothetical protein